MRLQVRAFAVPAAIIVTIGTANAQGNAPEGTIAYILVPSPVRVSPPAIPRTADPFRYPVAIRQGSTRASRFPDLPITVQRRTSRFGSMPTTNIASSPAGAAGIPRSYDLRPRSRMTRLRVEENLPLGDSMIVRLGWHGVKVSNRNANIAIDGGNDRLSAHDWFLPRASLAYRPHPDLTVSFGYRETMRAYEGVGSVGPMGLNRADFDVLREALRPERSQQLRMDGRWATDDVSVSLGGYRAAVRDTLSFVYRGYQPVNGASATLSGMSALATGHLTSSIEWTARYRHAVGQTGLNEKFREQELSVGGTWTNGAWHGSMEANHASGATLPGLTDRRRPGGIRVEAAIDYAAAGIGGRPMTLSVRLTDPSQFTSVRLTDDGGGLRAADRARALMFGASSTW